MPARLPLLAGAAAGAALLVVAAAGSARAADPTGREIMDRVDKDHRVKDEQAEADMILQTEGRSPRRRKVVIFSQAAEGDDDNTVIRFLAPADVKGTALLTREEGAGETQYVYLPALRKARRIASSSKSERFAGTDFTYEDLRTEQLDQHDYKRLGSEEVDGADCWKIEAVASTDTRREETAYGRRIIWVRKDHFLVVKVDYFDKQGKHHKTLRQIDWKPVGESKKVWRFHKAAMQDHLRDSTTLMRYAKREILPGLADRVFTKNELGNP